LETTANHHRKTVFVSIRGIYLLAAVVMVILSGLVMYGFHMGGRLQRVDAPLIIALHEIQLEATNSRLWIENILNRQTENRVEGIWKYLDQTVWYFERLCVTRGKSGDPILTHPASALDEQLATLNIRLTQYKTSTRQMISAHRNGLDTTVLALENRENFNALMAYLHDMEKSLNTIAGQNEHKYSIAHTGAVGILVVLMSILAMVIKRIEHQRTEHLRTLEESNQRLNIEIGEREKAQKALKASEALFRNVFRTSPEAIVISRLSDGLILDVNEGFKVLTGHSKSAVIGKTAEEINLWKASRNRKAFVENLNRYGSVRNLATQFITRDGSVKSVLLSSKIVPLQNEPNILTVARDITEIKAAEARLKKSEEKFRSFFEAAADLIHLFDGQGRILMTNPAALERLQYNADQMIGRMLSDFMTVRSAEDFRRHFHSLLSHGFHRGEYELMTSSGAVVNVDTSASVIRGDNGEPLHIISFQKDITERKLAERKLEASHRFLLIANRHSKMTPVLDAFMKEIKNLTRCQAVAVRILNDNGSAPYAASFGFEPEVCVLEKADSEGPFGASGNLGICRHMLNGKLFSALPCFTEHGSFHSNHTSQFWGSIANYEKDITKNVCSQVGFESLALIPIRLGEATIGLIHVADRQKNKIFPSIVEILESAAMQLGSAIQRIRAEEALEAAYDELERTVQARTEELRKTNLHLQEEIEEHRKTEQSLLQYQTQLRTLSAELLKAGERERRRIAAEIHDRIGQTLAITKIQLGALRACLSDKKILMSVDAVRDLVSQTIKDTRSLTFELSPPVLYELGLMAALQWLAETLQKQSGLIVQLKHNNGDETRINNTIRELLFRTIRELLLNVVKHAQARQAIVSIYILPNHVTVVVRDDGVGFSPDTLNAEDTTSRGFGLFSIQEQLNHHGGRSTIDTLQGAGTQITIELPLTGNGVSRSAKD